MGRSHPDRSLPAGPTPATPAVRLDGVSVRYGATAALRDVDLEVEAGACVALVGPSGAGKSTLLGLANGSVRPASGTVRVLGRDLGGLGAADLRRLRTRIGTVHQRLDLVGPLRVVHNVNAGRLGGWSAARSLWSLLRPQGVDEVVAALDQVGLASRVFDRTDELSGGQQQRVALARVLVQGPALVLADEPVSSLDPELSALALARLRGLARDGNATVLMSLHDPALAVRFCDRLVGLRAGAVVLDRPASGVTHGMLGALYRREP